MLALVNRLGQGNTWAGEAGQGRKAVTPPSRQHSEHGCIKLWIGSRIVPVRSGPDGSRTWWFSGHPRSFLRAANRDGSRSGEFEAAQQREQDLMKTLDIPKSRKCGTIVVYRSRFEKCQRAMVVPKTTKSPARQHMRGKFGRFARAWGTLLTQAQREAWNVTGPKVQSKKRLT